MAPITHSNGTKWGFCAFCRAAIWRYLSGKVWRNALDDSHCRNHPYGIHIPEY